MVYNAGTKTISLSYPGPVQLETPADLATCFDSVINFWQKNCAPQKVFFLVNWSGFGINMREHAAYTHHLHRVLKCAITIVRYGDNPIQRAAARIASMKLHVPSHVYESREEALGVIADIQAGVLRVAPAPSP
jgi:hypothetical protein